MQVLLQKNVKFIQKDIEDAWNTHLDDSDWEDVVLPHDWAVSNSFSESYSSGTGYLPGGTGWYRIPFDMPENAQDYDISVCFEGVYKHAYVWCNQYYLGNWANGYTSFDFNISHAVWPGKKNLISVKVCHEDIADSRWYTGSGIQRNVKLVMQPKVHEIINERVFTVGRVNGNTAEIETTHVITNVKKNESTYRITDYFDGVERISQVGKIGAGESIKVQLKYNVDNIRQWSPESPTLYQWKTVVESEKIKDENFDQVGIVKTYFDADKGFFCNGKATKLKGVCLHEDAGSFGNAVPKNVWERRLLKLKEMGTNTIRMSHNPHSECLYELCDELGFFVIDEVFDEWEGCKNKWWHGHNVYPPKHQGYYEDFPTWHEKDVEAFVKARRNHPAIIMWSIGNEIDYPNDPYCHKSFGEMTGNNDAGKPVQERQYDEQRPDASRLVPIASELVHLVKKYDTTRPVSLASAFPELSSNTGLFNDLDVIGYNYKEQFYESDHKRFPDKPIFGSENGHDYSMWKHVVDNEYISGQCLWTGIDYLGETSGWPEHGSRAGHLTTAGFEKPDFYFRKSMWDQENPFVKLATCPKETSDWMELRKFIWDYKDGEEIKVEAYSNLEEVELFINEKSLGKVRRNSDGKFSMVIPFEKGILKAVAKDKDGNRYIDELTTDNKPCRLEAKVISDVKADGVSCVQVEVTVLDAKGNIARQAEIPVTVAAEGEISFLHMDNGNLADTTDYTSNERKTYDGRLMVYVRTTDNKGKAVLRLDTKELGETVVEFETK